MKVLLKDASNPNSGVVVPVTVTVRDMDLRHSQDGEVVYVLEFVCGAIDANGDRIHTVVIEYVTETNVKNQIKEGLAVIGRQINWPDPQADTDAPRILEIVPSDGEVDVSINEHIRVKLRDYFPTTGIDPSTIKLRVNGIDVTDDLHISGEDTEYRIRWVPVQKL